MPRRNRRRPNSDFNEAEVRKFTDDIMKKINSQIVPGPSKPGQHLVTSLRRRELGLRTKDASNMEIYDCVLRNPSRCYRTTDEITGTKMLYSKRGHLVQCHPNPALYTKDDFYRKWECFQYLPGEKFREQLFIEIPYDYQTNTSPASILVIRTSFERLFFIDCENELVLKLYQLPNIDTHYHGFIYSRFKNELYIQGEIHRPLPNGGVEPRVIVVIFEMSPIRLKMFTELEKQVSYQSVFYVFDGYLTSYTRGRGKLQIRDLDEIYKQLCFDVDEPSSVDGVIYVKRNVHIKNVEPLLSIDAKMDDQLRFLAGLLYLDRFRNEEKIPSEFRCLKDPRTSLHHGSRNGSNDLDSMRLDYDDWAANFAEFTYETRMFDTGGQTLSCYQIENPDRTSVHYDKKWSHELNIKDVIIDDQYLNFYGTFLKLLIEGPYVYYAVQYHIIPFECDLNFLTTVILMCSLGTGEILKTMLVGVTPHNGHCTWQTNSLMLTDEGEICYQTQEQNGVTNIYLFSLTDQEALKENNKKLEKAAATAQRGLNRRQRRLLRRNNGARQ